MQKIWNFQEAKTIFDMPLLDLLFKAQMIHGENFVRGQVQISTLLDIKTGSCPENCSYCPQSAHYNTGLKKEPLMQMKDILDAAKRAKEAGASRFCMGAAWRAPREEDLDFVCETIREIKKLGLESCVTLGLLEKHHAMKLKEAGCDFYNHNIDTSEEFYSKIITTRKFEDRLKTIEYVQEAKINVCSGGIIGMGESNDDRIKMLLTLANLENPPKSIPINKLIRVKGTPLANQEDIDFFDFIRTIALARIMFPKSYVRLSAGRADMSDEQQTLCFVAGANSIFYGEKLLVTENATPEKDDQLFHKIGLEKV